MCSCHIYLYSFVAYHPSKLLSICITKNYLALLVRNLQFIEVWEQLFSYRQFQYPPAVFHIKFSKVCTEKYNILFLHRNIRFPCSVHGITTYFTEILQHGESDISGPLHFNHQTDEPNQYVAERSVNECSSTN